MSDRPLVAVRSREHDQQTRSRSPVAIQASTIKIIIASDRTWSAFMEGGTSLWLAPGEPTPINGAQTVGHRYDPGDFVCMRHDGVAEALGEVFFQSLGGPTRFLGGQPTTLLNRLEDIDRMIDALLADRDDCTMVQLISLKRPLLPSGIPDHLVDVGVCRGRQAGVIGFTDVSASYATWSPSGLGVPARYFLVGDARDFPAFSEVPLVLLRKAVKEFLLTDGWRPTCVDWQAYAVLPPDFGEEEGEDPWVAAGRA